MRILGLDLGTQSSSFAVLDNGKVTVLPLDSSVSIPSVVLHEPSGQVLVGKAAFEKSQQDPRNCYMSLLQLLCLSKSERKGKRSLVALAPAPTQHIQSSTSGRLLTDLKTADPEMWVDEGYQLLAPSFVVAELLKRLYAQAAAAVHDPIDKVVLTCPGYFNSVQRQALKDAVSLAQIPVPCSIVSESSANALYLGHTLFAQLQRQQSNLNDCLVLMYSWSAGKFECSVLALNYKSGLSAPEAQEEMARRVYGSSADASNGFNGVTASNGISGHGLVEVLASFTDQSLSGDALTHMLVDLLVNDFNYRHQIDLSKSREAMHRLFIAAEKAKVTLSREPKAEVLVPYICQSKGQDLHLKVELDAEQIIRVVYQPFIRKTVALCQRCLDAADVSLDQISQVLLVGKVTQYPELTETLKLLFSESQGRSELFMFEQRQWNSYVPKFVSLDSSLNPAACGAALYPNNSCPERANIELIECMPYAIGVKDGDTLKEIVPRFTPLPVSESQTLMVMEYAKDSIYSNTSSQRAFFRREMESSADNIARGCVTILLNHGACTLAELTLPHVMLVAGEIPGRRKGGFFVSDSIAVAKVTLKLKIETDHSLSVSLSDATNPSNERTWQLPGATLSTHEIARMQQELELHYRLERNAQHIKALSELPPYERLSYVDRTPELQPLLQQSVSSLAATNLVPSLTASSKDKVAIEQTDLNKQSERTKQTRGDLNTLSGTAANLATISTAGRASAASTAATAALKLSGLDKLSELPEILSRAEISSEDVSLESLSLTVNQQFAEDLGELLAQAASSLNTYHECTQSLEGLKDLLKAALQELSRVKQKSEQELTKTKKFALEKFLQDLIPVYDALDQAVLFGKEHSIDGAILQGQQQILELLENVLRQHGIVVEDPSGQLFNPQFHQAVSMLSTSEVAPKHVAKTLQKGLILNERLVRPAQVIVAKAPEPAVPMSQPQRLDSDALAASAAAAPSKATDSKLEKAASIASNPASVS